MGEFNINLNMNKLRGDLRAYLTQRMTTIVIKMVAFVKTSFGPSNMDGTNPSEPGQPPNIGTGTLRNNIGFSISGTSDEVVGVYGVLKGPASDYALRLELGFYGTDGAGRTYSMEARPYLKPAFNKNKQNIIKWIQG
jgi:hypothetical protein